MGRRRDGWIGGHREKVRGVYGFSSLMKQNKTFQRCFALCTQLVCYPRVACAGVDCVCASRECLALASVGSASAGVRRDDVSQIDPASAHSLLPSA